MSAGVLNLREILKVLTKGPGFDRVLEKVLKTTLLMMEMKAPCLVLGER
jgi:hypothetical protein